ncbi:MAG: phycobiliprotein lyase [Cyanobacteriota bacterium]
MKALEQFHYFFNCCIGAWSTERTYHHLARGEVEHSHTEFIIRTLTPDLKHKVLTDNHYPNHGVDGFLGFHLAFETVSETGEEVNQEVNMLFVPKQETAAGLEGDYLRDRAYEEDRPIVAAFRFDPRSLQLNMTTTYTHVVAVDSITLLNPRLRLRQILTYQRPPAGQLLQDLLLVGFGVEQKLT